MLIGCGNLHTGLLIKNKCRWLGRTFITSLEERANAMLGGRRR
jgi:hypothetical protein